MITANNRRLTDADPPAGVARRLPAQFRNQTLYILCSPLLGAGLHSLPRDLPPASAVLLVELNRDLADLQDDSRWEIAAILNTQINWVTDMATAQRLGEEHIRSRGIRAVEIVNLTGGARFARERYQWLQQQLTALVQQHWKNRGAMIRLGRRWITNTVHNSVQPVQPLSHLLTHIRAPVLLCGAGPQLDAHISWIKSIRTTCTVVALDTALPTLAAVGIVPDVIWAMDGQVANALDLMPWRWASVPVAVDLTAHPTFLRRFAPNQRYGFLTEYTDPLPVSAVLPRDIPLLPPRGSVAPSAVEGLVRWCRVRHILSVGVDFWYRTPKSHSSMSAPHRGVLHRHDRLTGTGGDLRLLMRPMVDVHLRDGTSARGDAILADQAAQLAHTVATLRHEFPDFECYSLGHTGLDTGMPPVSPAWAAQWLNARFHNRRTVEEDRTTASGAVVSDAPALPQALRALVSALRVQEERILSDPTGPIFLCDDVRFVLLDLPQWPLLELQQEWVQLHRGAILRSLRDYRRRFENQVARCAAPGTGSESGAKPEPGPKHEPGPKPEPRGR